MRKTASAKRDSLIVDGRVSETRDVQYGGPSRSTLRSRAGKGNVWVSGKLYMRTSCNLDAIRVGDEISWQWATSRLGVTPAPETQLLLANETDGRQLRIRVASASCGSVDSRNVKAGRRASGSMSSVAISKMKHLPKPVKSSRQAMDDVDSLFSDMQTDAFLAIEDD